MGPKSVDRRGVENEGYLVASLLKSCKVDLHRTPQRVRDHSGRRALVVEPYFELDGRCAGGHGGCIRLEGVILRLRGVGRRDGIAGTVVRSGTRRRAPG